MKHTVSNAQSRHSFNSSRNFPKRRYARPSQRLCAPIRAALSAPCSSNAEHAEHLPLTATDPCPWVCPMPVGRHGALGRPIRRVGKPNPFAANRLQVFGGTLADGGAAQATRPASSSPVASAGTSLSRPTAHCPRRDPGKERVAAITEKYGVTVPQLCSRYAIQRDLLSLPKTANPSTCAPTPRPISRSRTETWRRCRTSTNGDYGNSSAFPVYSGK
jgi:hypothetical protein